MSSSTWLDADPTVGEYLTDWLARKGALRPSTRRSYAGHINLYLAPHLGTIPLRELGPADIAQMYDEISSGSGRPVGAATLERIHATLLSALNAARRHGLIRANPAALLELPRPTRSENLTWTHQELARFLEIAKTDAHYPLFVLLAMCGLRRGEGVGLRFGDIDFDEGLIRVQRSVTKVGAEVLVGEVKTRSSRRVVALDRRTCGILRNYVDDQARLRAVDRAALVFADTDGGVLDPTAVSRRFDRLVERAGLPRIRLHDLRHTSASVGLESGESLLEVSRRLGHSSITVTADVYSHIAPHISHDSAARVADLIYQSQPQHNQGEK